MKQNLNYDIIVVGAGHGGCEAALASARMGSRTLLLTMNLDTIARMSCNPAIGGLAKGHIVREIDALGGEMGKVTDETGIQFRLLNKSKGPAVWAPRAQCDKNRYHDVMRSVVENQQNLDLKQGDVSSLIVTNKTVQGVVTSIGTIYYGHSVIISPGTFLNGLIHIGDVSFGGGRAEDGPSIGLTSCLEQLGLKTMRLKTGTPCRLNSTSINYNELEPQYGDSDPRPFSHFTEKISTDQVPCHIAFTNAKTHAIIKHNIQRSPLYSGKIRGVGPRYCPSIESKIVRFEDKDRHQVFLEPEGKLTNEVYVNGLSTSLPHDVQIKFIRSIKGLERAEIMRFGYAVEYDSVNPTQLKATLETKTVDNLYLAGQINGTSGYEEAACQGLVASINANLKLRGKSPFVLRRDEAYIGVLIDDLVTKGTIEPYRMFTSRAEHRLFLRQDNADSRLMNYGRAFGLLTKDQHDKYLYDEATLERLRSFIKTEKHDGTTIYKYIKRPEILIGDIADMLKSDHVSVRIAEKLAIEVKYEGYIQRELSAIMRSQKLESKKIPQGMEYLTLHGLRLEAREKFQEIQPTSIGQASRISGISPCDISMLMIHMKKMRVYENEVLHQNG